MPREGLFRFKLSPESWLMLRQEEAAIVGNIYYSSFVREPEVHCVDIRSLSEDKGATASREKGFIQRG